MITMKVPRSKGDQLKQKDEVTIARAGSWVCPVVMLEQYMTKTAAPIED